MANNLKSIFELDPESKPKPRTQFQDDTVGRFRSGRLDGKQPMSLSEWRVTTGDPTVADTVVELLGGEPAAWDTEKEDNLEILTDAKSVKIIIDSSDSIDASMKKFGFSGIEHHCDGRVYLSDDDPELIGQPCGCPTSVDKRKDLARSGKGPKPSVDVTFRLADAPQLGYFRFNSGSWSLVDVLHELFEAVDKTGGREYNPDGRIVANGGPVTAVMSIEHNEYDTKAGRHVSYNFPQFKITGAYTPTLSKGSSATDEPPF